MALFRGEGEPSRAIDPVIAFMHNDNNPRDGIVDASGEVIPLNEHQRLYGPPSPMIFTDISTGMEKMVTVPDQSGEEVRTVVEFLEPQLPSEAQNPINHERRPLSLRRLVATAVLPLLG